MAMSVSPLTPPAEATPPSSPPGLSSPAEPSSSPPSSTGSSPKSAKGPPPKRSKPFTAIHPPDDDHRVPTRDFRRRSMAIAQMASINTTAANSLRARHHSIVNTSSTSPNRTPGGTSPSYSSGSSYSPNGNTRNNNHNTDDETADLLPLLSPSAQMAQQNPEKPYWPGGDKSLSGISERAFFLGITFALGVVSMTWTLAATSSPLWRVPFLVVALSLFHFLEFWTTAQYNTPNAFVSSFLLSSNGRAYLVAHTAAFTESLIVGLLFPDRQWAPLSSGPIIILAGLFLVVAGQTVRSAAMIQCGTNFNHIVQHKRANTHELVTTGIYATFRHPSYFGYFWWALGTQVVMGNVICFVGYWIVLHRFFSRRIGHEEEFLMRFFGGDYVKYRECVGTRIPFIR